MRSAENNCQAVSFTSKSKYSRRPPEDHGQTQILDTQTRIHRLPPSLITKIPQLSNLRSTSINSWTCATPRYPNQNLRRRADTTPRASLPLFKESHPSRVNLTRYATTRAGYEGIQSLRPCTLPSTLARKELNNAGKMKYLLKEAKIVPKQGIR